jgi:hypothetical protein
MTAPSRATRRPGRSAGMRPLTPERKWRAITLASLVLAPAAWSLLAGLVALASDGDGGPQPAAAIALGLALVPFTFIVLAFASEHPTAPGAVLRAMGLFLLVGIPVSAVAADAVTGIVAAFGAGGVVALRRDAVHELRLRAGAVAVAAAYAFVLARVAGPAVVVAAPILPFTSIGLADHLAEWRRDRAALAADPTPDA